MTVREAIAKCLWLFELLVDEGPPRTAGELARSTGIDRVVSDGCLAELLDRGVIVMNSRSHLLPRRMASWTEIV